MKPTRSRAEYCWTLTPWSIQWALSADSGARRVTYIDADTFFLKSPSDLFYKLDSSGKSFLITEHGFSPFHDQTSTSGRFCVQFVTVHRGCGEQALHWWRDRCIEWCFARSVNGLFGDQMYFEQLSLLFADLVYIVSGDGRFLAPWNTDYYRYSDAILFHFHGLRLLTPNRFILSSYSIPSPVLNHIYKPYASLICSLFAQYPELSLHFKPQIKLSFITCID